MKGPNIPKVIPPAYTPTTPQGAGSSGPSAYSGAFSSGGSNSMALAAAATRKKTLIGGAA